MIRGISAERLFPAAALHMARHVSNRVFRSIVGADTGRPIIALTFDDGPGPDTAPVLDILARHDARATFFTLGCNVASNKSAVTEIRDAGHALGHHTFSHASLPQLSPGAMWRDIHDGRRAVEDVAGVAVTLMRPPFGHQSWPLGDKRRRVG